MTATGAKFSDAIISRVDCWRWSSASTAAATSGSSSWRELLRRDMEDFLGRGVRGSALDEGGVLVGRQQLARLAADLHLEQPTALEGGGVHQRGVGHDVLVDLDDLAVDGGVEIADRLGRLQLTAGLARRDLLADLGKLHVDHIAERVGGVLGDADRRDAVLGGRQPLVLLAVAQLLGVAHGSILLYAKG